MATIRDYNGVKRDYEAAGSGVPSVFVHEYAGDVRSWEALRQAHFLRSLHPGVSQHPAGLSGASSRAL